MQNDNGQPENITHIIYIKVMNYISFFIAEKVAVAVLVWSASRASGARGLISYGQESGWGCGRG